MFGTGAVVVVVVVVGGGSLGSDMIMSRPGLLGPVQAAVFVSIST